MITNCCVLMHKTLSLNGILLTETVFVSQVLKMWNWRIPADFHMKPRVRFIRFQIPCTDQSAWPRNSDSTHQLQTPPPTNEKRSLLLFKYLKKKRMFVDVSFVLDHLWVRSSIYHWGTIRLDVRTEDEVASIIIDEISV